MTHDEAVQSVLAHWKELSEAERLTAGVNIGFHSNKCAFCTLYVIEKISCSTKCPIKQITNQNYCGGTPWRQVATATTNKEFKTAAKEMYEFIKIAVS